MSLVRPSLIRPISRSSDSVGQAIDRIPGRKVGRVIGEEWVELWEDSRDEDEGALYILFKGGSLY